MYTDVKKRDESRASNIKEWALLRGLKVIDRQSKDKLADVILGSISRVNTVTEAKSMPIFKSGPAQKMIRSGLKMHAGQVRFWGKANPKDTLSRNDVLPNTFRRP